MGSEVERQPSCARKIFRDAGIEDELVVSTRVDPTTRTVQQPQTWLGYHRRRLDQVVLNAWSLFALEWLQDMHHRDPIPKGDCI